MSRPARQPTGAERDERSYEESRAVLGPVESGVWVDEAIIAVLAARRHTITPTAADALDTKPSDEEP